MPASTKKVTKPAARKGTRSLSTAEAARKLAKSPTAAAANAAIVAAREPKAAGKELALLTKLKNKPFTDAGNAKREPVTALGAIRAEIAEKAAAKAVRKNSNAGRKLLRETAAKAEKPAATGAKAKILDMIAAKGGTSAAEVCKALGWARAGATIGRAIKLATFKVRKERDADGVLRYYAA